MDAMEGSNGRVTFDPSIMKTVADLTSSVSKEMTFDSTDFDGMSMKVTMVDPSHTMICSSMLSIPAPVQGRWAVEIDKLQQALKGKEASMSYDGALVVQAGHMVSRIPLMEPEDSPKVPSIDYTAHATILASDIKAIVKDTDAKKVPFVALTIDEQGVTVESRDEMGYGQTLAVPPEECLDLTVEVPARATFGTDLMQRFLKNVPNDAEISLDMSKDYPIRISLTGEGWQSEWVCAPVIQSD